MRQLRVRWAISAAVREFCSMAVFETERSSNMLGTVDPSGCVNAIGNRRINQLGAIDAASQVIVINRSTDDVIAVDAVISVSWSDPIASLWILSPEISPASLAFVIAPSMTWTVSTLFRANSRLVMEFSSRRSPEILSPSILSPGMLPSGTPPARPAATRSPTLIFFVSAALTSATAKTSTAA